MPSSHELYKHKARLCGPSGSCCCLSADSSIGANLPLMWCWTCQSSGSPCDVPHRAGQKLLVSGRCSDRAAQNRPLVVTPGRSRFVPKGSGLGVQARAPSDVISAALLPSTSCPVSNASRWLSSASAFGPTVVRVSSAVSTFAGQGCGMGSRRVSTLARPTGLTNHRASHPMVSTHRS